jgi:MFS family permease
MLSQAIRGTDRLVEKMDRNRDNATDATFRRVAWRLMPLLFGCYVVAYLDRINVGFAKLQMLTDLGLSEGVYGLGAGLFFIGYFLFEVPSNLLLHRLGARRWIARIMITWAVVSIATAWVRTPASFYVLRFILGVSEAGFFPGIILYLTYWFPSHRRGRMVSLFMAGSPVSGMVGGVASGAITTYLDGWLGLHGWQWLYIVEGVPAVVLGFVLFKVLDDRIDDARWLTEQQKAEIKVEFSEDNAARTHASPWAALLSGRVYLLCVIAFGMVVGSYAIGFWLPTIIKNAGIRSSFTVGILMAIPYAAALLAMLVGGRTSDHFLERRWHVIVPALIAAAGFVICAQSATNITLAMVGLTMATAGVVCALCVFWTLPSMFLGGAGAAAGIALINSTANLAGFVSPVVIGWSRTQTHSLSSGLYLVATSVVLSALMILLFVPARIVNR